MAIISVNNISKNFRVYTRKSGMMGNIKALFKREYTIKQAVKDISFDIERGEIVGYIGPNGAGKSTTIKMLTGILYPSSGEIIVNGLIPYKNRRGNAMKIGVVFGQRSQLYWDLPMIDTFDLYKKMYHIDDYTFKNNVEFYVQLLDMAEFINRPIRQLSLGQKMRAEFSVALLHDPEIVYLDEPTIGLDIISKKSIRDFIKKINEEKGTTFIITTHDMDDIEEVCERLILIDHGSKQYDGTLNAFKSQYITDNIIEFSFEGTPKIQHDIYSNEMKITILREGNGRIVFNNKKYSSVDIINILMKYYNITNIKTCEYRIEDVLNKLYAIENKK